MDSSLQNWIGRRQTQTDEGAASRIDRLAALLDHDPMVWGEIWTEGDLPPLAHWLYFLPADQQSQLDEDGHPKRGGFMPPVALPRRMWAGSDIIFYDKIKTHQRLERHSEILSITEKTSRSGEALIFVKIGHEILGETGGRVEEMQSIVYRPALLGDGAQPFEKTQQTIKQNIKHSRNVHFDAASLFRFSALTFNAHRIHYDRDYARREGYPGLVVQGPFLAILLMDYFLSHHPRAALRRFSFRAERALFDISSPAQLCLDEAGALWAQNRAGERVMSAQIECA